MENIKENLNKVRSAITAAELKYGHPKGFITLVAVSKAQSIEKIKAAFELGQIHFAENYLQESLPKIKELQNQSIIWHYIGKVQSNKAKLIAQNFSWVETISSYKVADLLNKYRPIDLPPLNVCIQINISNEKNKAGVPPKMILPLAQKITQLPKLKLRGLMAIPPHLTEFAAQLKIFHEVFLEFKKLQKSGMKVDTLSMGMSDDFAAAIAAGATSVRIGTAIFGKRAEKSCHCEEHLSRRRTSS